MNELLSLESLAKMSNADLAKTSSQITGRLNNEDWQQLVFDLRNSGHIHTFPETAPLLLQRFIRLEADLDKELSKRSATSPLLSTVELNPKRPRPEDRQLLATLASQDNAAMMSVDINPLRDSTDFSFTVRSMLTLRFEMPRLDLEERRTFLNNMRRDYGMAFLWTRERWEQDYMIFIKQEYFTRVYAFSRNLEATARMTNEAIGTLLDWLEKCWFPRNKKRSTQSITAPSTPALPAETAAPVVAKPALPREATDTLLRIVKKLEVHEPEKTEGENKTTPPAAPPTSGGEANDPFTW